MLLLLTVLQAKSTTAQTVGPILRARALELVDERNVVRARLDVKESELDLFDKNGIIRVKLGAGEDGSALVLSEGAAVRVLQQKVFWNPELNLSTYTKAGCGSGS